MADFGSKTAVFWPVFGSLICVTPLFSMQIGDFHREKEFQYLKLRG
jgi:hypothetical protein